MNSPVESTVQRRHRRDWEEMAAVDPLFAILSDTEKRFSKWDMESFFLTGEQEISVLVEQMGRLALPKCRKTAIDFGCGIGRLTRALRRTFPNSIGVDISEFMLEKARELNPECRFIHSPDLTPFPDQSADLIYSYLVLQHQPSQARLRNLITDMVRVLAPGGLLVFQVPSKIPVLNRLQLRRRLYRLGRALRFSHRLLYTGLHLTPIRMISLKPRDVADIVRKAGGKVVSSVANEVPGYSDAIYYCTR
jgi:SAM-dependent methyltransferase